MFCDDDIVAAGLYLAARERGLRIPRDLSVVGFDDMDFARVLDPALTTVALDAELLGATAFALLEERMGGGAPAAARRAAGRARGARLDRAAAVGLPPARSRAAGRASREGSRRRRGRSPASTLVGFVGHIPTNPTLVAAGRRGAPKPASGPLPRCPGRAAPHAQADEAAHRRRARRTRPRRAAEARRRT